MNGVDPPPDQAEILAKKSFKEETVLCAYILLVSASSLPLPLSPPCLAYIRSHLFSENRSLPGILKVS